MFARSFDALPNSRSYFDPYGSQDYAYVRRQQELARRAELEAAYRRELAARAYRQQLEEAERQEQRRRYYEQQQAQQRRPIFFPAQTFCFPARRQQPAKAPAYTRADQEQAASLLQSKWRQRLNERKITQQLRSIYGELRALQAEVAFPSQPAFDSNGNLLYNAHNAPIHAYVDKLEKLLLKLDAIESHGLASIKDQRKQVVRAIEQELARVEAFKVKAWEAARPAKSLTGGFQVPITSGSEASAPVQVDQAAAAPVQSAEFHEASSASQEVTSAAQPTEIHSAESQPASSPAEAQLPSEDAQVEADSSAIQVDAIANDQPSSEEDATSIPIDFPSKTADLAQEQAMDEDSVQETDSKTTRSADDKADDLESLHSDEEVAETFVLV